jgi:very-short-patch-repair endonuclease
MIPPRSGEGDRAAKPRGGGGVPKARASEGGVPQTQSPRIYAARQLRREMSLPEVMLWQRLRRKASGMKFRRQHPIGSYVADFYSSSLKLVIEVDGADHDMGSNPARDLRRDAFMRENGYEVLRIAASDILRDADKVACAIAALGKSPLHHPADGPPPRAGEDCG